MAEEELPDSGNVGGYGYASFPDFVWHVRRTLYDIVML